MNDDLVQRVSDALWQKMNPNLPRAFCIGQVPENPSFLPVQEAPWDMVVLCALSPAQLLQMPCDAVCTALLEGKPVYLIEEGLLHRRYPKDSARALQTMLLSKERQLRDLGVKLWGKTEKRKLLTAKDVQNLRMEDLPAHAVLTPLARDILEGKR